MSHPDAEHKTGHNDDGGGDEGNKPTTRRVMQPLPRHLPDTTLCDSGTEFLSSCHPCRDGTLMHDGLKAVHPISLSALQLLTRVSRV